MIMKLLMENGSDVMAQTKEVISRNFDETICIKVNIFLTLTIFDNVSLTPTLGGDL